MLQDVTVVQADLGNPQHQEAVVCLVNAYARDPIGMGRDLPDDVRAALIPGLRRHPTTLILLAISGGQPVGIAVCFTGFSTFAARPLINIHDLAVLPGQRNRGVGRRLLEGVEAKARSLGCCKVTLEVRRDNANAKHLYQSFGFTGIEQGSGASGDCGGMWFLEKRL
jgi:ribosomal protein S18 acetylase RimI-like enzyme